jgi:superfamily II DNA or RNA helicase
LLLPGASVRARGLEWEIVHVEPAGEQQRYRLRCTAGALRGRELDLLHPFEPVETIASDFDPAKAGRLAPWLLYHQAFLLEQVLGSSALLANQPGRLDIAPYQLVPVMRALAMSRLRLLLADGVGLGKTIEAGLVLAELIARRRAHRVLIVSPAGPLLDQWELEMRTRLGLRFQPIRDWGALQELRRSLELGANPFDHVALCLISIDFAKQEKVLQDLERTSWDVVVIDEAHHCVRVGGGADREASLRRRLAEVLARQADGLMLLTATPHDGFDLHFASLVELLDPSLVNGRGELRGDAYRRHVIRRLKRHLKDPTGAPLFREREVEPRPVLFSRETHPVFARFQEELLALIAPRLRSAVKSRRYGDVLAFISLLKRSVSTATACCNTVGVIASRFEDLKARGAEDQEARRQRLRTLREYQQRLGRYGALSFEEEQDQAALEAEDMAAELFTTSDEEVGALVAETRRDVRREGDRQRRTDETLRALRALEAAAAAACAEDPKLDAVHAELLRIRVAEPHANVLVYTEYSDSQRAIVEFLRAAGDLAGEVLALSGSDGERDRKHATQRFCTEDDLVLVSTDATAEGLNLHARCHHLIHVELPYNPNRLEQRNGRIDRYGQQQVPQVRYLYLGGTFEERLLLRLVAKYERQRARLTFVPNTLGNIAAEGSGVAARLLAGLAAEEGTLFQREKTPLRFDAEPLDDTASPAYRELLEEVERAVAGFERAARTSPWLGEAGLNAEERLSSEASDARSTGAALAQVDLLAFVCAALESETGSASSVTRDVDDTVVLALPTSWTADLDGLPGFDLDAKQMRLTADPQRETRADGASLGFLGRAHPLVQRALARVRHFRLGTGESFLDPRVSAVACDGDEPALLCTYLGVVESAAGHEVERVIGVRIRAGGEPEAMTEPGAWQSLARLDRQIPTKDLWERHFVSWSEPRRADAETAARAAFEPLATGFAAVHRMELDRERAELDRWLRARTEELCGARAAETGDLFAPAAAAPSWRSASDPLERLASFTGDSAVPAARRREAEGVVALYAKRSGELARRAELRAPALVPLGLLMLVPGKSA